MVSWYSALAAGSCFMGTSRGTIAPRTGWLSPCANECRATRVYSTVRDEICAHECAASATVTAKSPNVVHSPTVRRLWASPMDPPYNPEMIRGTSAATPTMPTANVERVSSKTSRLIATTVN